MSTNERIKRILTDCCAGNASLATSILHAEFVIIDRDELPEVNISEHGNGFVTALAQERYQPALRLGEGEQNTGAWSRNIAYANLAVAEAISAQTDKDTEALKSEAHELYLASCEHIGIAPMAVEWADVQPKYEAIARKARELHGGAK